MYRYEPIEGLPLAELAECLNLAFSDYYLPVRLNESALAGICKASRVDEKLSFAAFQGEQMVGALLHSRGIYRGKTVLFDVAAGVIPEHRGKKVFTTLFSFAEQEARRQGVEACCLEVLQQNEKAIALYIRLFCQIIRSFRNQPVKVALIASVLQYPELFKLFLGKGFGNSGSHLALIMQNIFLVEL